MIILNWICFLLICLDIVAYIIDKSRGEKFKGFAPLAGLLVGIAARVYALFNTATCWLLK